MSDTNVHRVVGNLLVGTSHFFVDTTTNRVGVNTSSPSASLDIATGDLKVGSGITIGNSGTITAANFSGNGSGLSGINSDSGSWVNGNNSNVHLALSTDNVGIATATPMTKLDIAYNAAAPAIVFSDTTNSRYQTGIGSFHVSNEGQRLDFYTGDSLTNGTLLTNTPRMSITGTGNVGVNTTSPASGLHVRNPGGADVASSITIQPASTQYARGHAKIEAYPDATVGAGTGLKFYTRADSGSDFDPTSLVSARMTIKENGNVGVGSTSPTGRLEVEYTEGTLSSYSYATSSTWHNKGLALKGGNAGFLYGHDINHSIFLRQSPFGSTDHNAYCNVGYHAFYTGGHIENQTEKMRIASDGKLGIGTTTPHGALDVRGAVTITTPTQDSVATKTGYMAAGSLNIGSIGANFGGGQGWNGNTAGLMLECADNTEIAVHDSGTRVASLMYYQGGSNTITMGRDMGWGRTKINHAFTEKYNFHWNPNQWGYATNAASTNVNLWSFTLNVPHDGWIFIKCHAHWAKFNSSNTAHVGGNSSFYGWLSVANRTTNDSANYDSFYGATTGDYDKFHSYQSPDASGAGSWRDFNYCGFYRVSAGNNTISLRVINYFGGGDYLNINGGAVTGFYMPRYYL